VKDKGKRNTRKGTECMPQHSLSFCKTETLCVSLMDYRGEPFCHNVGQIFISRNIVQGKRLADEVFPGEMI